MYTYLIIIEFKYKTSKIFALILFLINNRIFFNVCSTARTKNLSCGHITQLNFKIAIGK